MKKNWNKTIICVDDEVPILQVYEEILNLENEIKSSDSELRMLYEDSDILVGEKKNYDYRLLLASSGEKAVKIAEEEKAAGREIAVAFCDMRLKDGIDGMETIRQLKVIFPEMLCAVVTAYTDCTIEQLGALFKNQDEWIYFNKPFSRGELIQIACNLVTSWNLRRENEKFVEELSMLIMHLSEIKGISLVDLRVLLKNVLEQIVLFVGSDSGFLATIDRDKKSLSFEVGVGRFSDEAVLSEATVGELSSRIFEAIESDAIKKVNEFVVLPIQAVQFESVIVYVDIKGLDRREQHYVHLLRILVQNVATAISNAKQYQNNLNLEIEKKELALQMVRKITTTLAHYINNPLTMVKGFATIENTDNIQERFKKIRRFSDEIVAVIDVLSKLNISEIERRIEFHVPGVEIIDIDKQLKEKIAKIEAAYKNVKE